MCTGSKPPKDNSAEIAAKAEADRQNRISLGVENIDNAFAGYNDQFYQDHTNQYQDYYMPQLDDKYSDAVKKLTLQLATTGNLTAKTGADQLSDLKEFYGQQGQAVTGQALNATQQLRTNVDNQMSQLYANNRAASDPGAASSGAISAAANLQPVAPSSPMANVFGDFFSNLGNVAAIRNAQSYNQGNGVESFGGGGGGSSVSVIS